MSVDSLRALLPSWSSRGARLNPPATEEGIARAEAALGTVLPAGFRDFYRVADGVDEFYGDIPTGQLFWSLQRMVARNLEAWAYSYDNDTWPQRIELLAFADYGSGEPFCVARDGRSEKVYFFAPIEDEVTLLTDTVELFLQAWDNPDVNLPGFR